MVCVIVALLVLGPDKLPQAARQVGRTIAEFKKFSAGLQAQVNDMISVDDNSSEKKPDGTSENTNAEQPAPDRDHVADLTRPHPNPEGFKLIDEPSTTREAEGGSDGVRPDPAQDARARDAEH